MATFYLDLEGGSDAADGTTFANRWKTFTSGATAARIAPGDTIRVMATKPPTSLGNGTWTGSGFRAAVALGASSSTNATPIVITSAAHGLTTGDTIQITGHTTNTKANGTWEVNVLTSSTFELVGSVGTTGAGSSGTWQLRNAQRVWLATANTAAIALPHPAVVNGGQGTKTAWTASASVTSSLVTTVAKQGAAQTQQLAIAAGFTTGLAAYFATGTIDLSGYQQVSFWIRQSAGTVAVSGDITLRLCTDTVGAVSVHTITVPALAALNQWVPVTVDLGANMNAAIASVALYVAVDRGAQTFQLDNIIACKASSSNDALTLNSLIGKNTSGETFWAIQSIVGQRVMLDMGPITLPSNVTDMLGYYGTTETCTTYKRETYATGPHTSGATASSVTDSGSAGNLITYSGGWNRTDMTTQTDETWLDGVNGLGTGLSIDSKTYVALEKFGFARYSSNLACANTCTGFRISYCHSSRASVGSGFSLVEADVVSNLSAVQNAGDGVTITKLAPLASVSNVLAKSNMLTGMTMTSQESTSWAKGVTLATLNASNNSSYGMVLIGWWSAFYASGLTSVSNRSTGGIAFNVNTSDSVLADFTIDGMTCTDNTGAGLIFNGSVALSIARSCIKNFTVTGNTAYGINFSIPQPAGLVLQNGTFSGNGTAAINVKYGELTGRNLSIAESTEYSAVTDNTPRILRFEKHDGTTDNHRIDYNGSLIVASTAQRHTASGISWKFSPVSTSLVSQYQPMELSIAKVAVGASALVTATVWVYRTNTGLTMKLVCKGGQIAGVTSDVSASASGSINTWEQLTITFTPTEIGAVEFVMQVYGGTTYDGYVDDFGVSQA